MNFPILANVLGGLHISSNTDFDLPWAEEYMALDRNSYPPLDVDFPYLQKAAAVTVRGNISRYKCRGPYNNILTVVVA